MSVTTTYTEAKDLHDLAVVAERRSEPTLSLEDMKRRLKKDGRL